MTDFAYLDGHHSIIGASDSGKTWTAKVGVEELLRQGRHTLIIDPLGVYWGMRSSIDGKRPAFDIPIFGGLHGDVPIGVGDGEAIAAIIDDQRVSAIVDLSLITDGVGQRTFMRNLVARLRRRRHGNFHFVVDEADEFVPEKPRDDIAFALQEDMLWIAKKGRSPAGWVLTLITQRTADISKSALSQSQTIFAHQLIAPQDQKPFLDYVRTKGTKAELTVIENNLASLQQGDRYVYSPRRHLLELGRSPALTTFDSSRTPEPGRTRAEPKTLAQLDVSKIRAALAKPASGELLAAIGKGGPPVIPGDMLEKLRQRDAQIAQVQADYAALFARVGKMQRNAETAIAAVDAAINDLMALKRRLQRDLPAQDGRAVEHIEEPEETPGTIARKGGQVMPAVTSSSEAARGARSAVGAGAGPDKEGAAPAALAKGAASDLPPAQQRILDQIAWSCEAFHKPAVPRQVLAIVLGVHPRTKGFLNNLGTLRTAGLIDYVDGGGIALTSSGVDLAETPAIAGAPLKDLRDKICRWLPAGQARILRLAIDAFPNAIARDRLAELLNTHPRTKSLLNNVGRLRTLGLLAGTAAHPRAAGYLFGKD
ncbi:MAG: hypothetical protein V4475_01750 [Pseudomonadota bacterium]